MDPSAFMGQDPSAFMAQMAGKGKGGPAGFMGQDPSKSKP